MSNQFSTEVLAVSQHCSNINCLIRADFKFQGLRRVDPTKSVSESFKIRLQNLQGMVIEMTYYPRDDYKSFFLVDIYQPIKNEPLDFEAWLKKHNKLKNKNAFRLSVYDGDFEQRLTAFCEFLDGALSDDAIQKILKGLEWESIPFAFGD